MRTAIFTITFQKFGQLNNINKLILFSILVLQFSCSNSIESKKTPVGQLAITDSAKENSNFLFSSPKTHQREIIFDGTNLKEIEAILNRKWVREFRWNGEPADPNNTYIQFTLTNGQFNYDLQEGLDGSWGKISKIIQFEDSTHIYCVDTSFGRNQEFFFVKSDCSTDGIKCKWRQSTTEGSHKIGTMRSTE